MTMEAKLKDRRAQGPSGLRRALDLVGVQNASLLLALLALVAVIGGLNSNFFFLANFESIGTTVTIVGVIAVVQTVVMLLGGLDISVGSEAGVTSVLSAMVFTATGSAVVGIAAALAMGMVLGLINGVIIVHGRVNAVIATLATFAGYRGLANLISDGRAQGYTGTDAIFNFIARGHIFGISDLIWIFLIVALIAQFILHYTDIGRTIYAIGGNPTVSRLAGIDLNRYIIAVYIIVGLVSALAGVLLTARTGSGQPTSGSQGLELQSITAAALGGCSLQGGRGTIIGTVLAVLLLGVLENGLIILNVNSFWQDIAQGALLVAAVVIQQRRAGSGRAVGFPT